ncbi:hypothetical protein LP418_08760 [Nocardioides sp. B-3]|nr:hypothetical protein [Nocardioides sp. B-3]UUZ60818.1 hypothetical protein LP418_08760 [Nocardioides sp. B-3]
MSAIGGWRQGRAKKFGVVQGVHRLLHDRATGARSVDHLAVADVERDVVDRGRLRARPPEEQVAGDQLGGRDRRGAGVLRD